MFERLQELWTERGFEIFVGLALVFILLYGLYRRITGKKGTWSNRYYPVYSPSLKATPTRSGGGRSPPKESEGELECRRVLREMFHRPFHKDRPDFLRNPVTGGNFNLELDCFDPELRIAVEYNGAQHYKYIPFFHKNKEAFLNQKYRDQMKRQMCKENGILLIEVPHTIKKEHIRSFLQKELRRAGVNC